MTSFLSDEHAAMLAGIWAMLERGATKSRDPLHTPVLGTVRNGTCSLRMVVLRHVDPETRTLQCHADARSPKVADIRLHHEVSWLFYHPDDKIQLRMTGLASVHTNDAIADEAWEQSPLLSRRCYCGLAPGTASDTPSSGMPAELVTREPTPEESAIGRQHFAVIRCRINTIDWLQLRFEGHLRTQFTWDANGTPAACWVTP